MCGRLVRDADLDFARYGVREIQEKRLAYRSFNIAPTVEDVIVRAELEGRRAVPSRWGLIPPWAKDRAIAAKTFNARAETIMERPAFRSLVGRHRCAIPASGFYEWQSTPQGKQPLYIRRADGEPLALAGLWAEWTDPATGERVTSHTIITTQANGTMAPFHQRMPVVLDGDGLDLWLDPAATDPAAVLGLLVPCPDDVLTAYPVAPLVNNVRNDGPELIAPAAAGD
jgi:putative SOS response-associated peptidase YedK